MDDPNRAHGRDVLGGSMIVPYSVNGNIATLGDREFEILQDQSIPTGIGGSEYIAAGGATHRRDPFMKVPRAICDLAGGAVTRIRTRVTCVRCLRKQGKK